MAFDETPNSTWTAGSNDASAGTFDSVPLFPLPGVVLFPHAILPLHIFESRYRTMTTDAIDGPLPIAISLLRPDAESSALEMDPIVCVGRIVKYERLADGRFNFLLEGFARAQIVTLTSGDASVKPYQTAHLSPLVESRQMEIDLERERRLLERALEQAAGTNRSTLGQFAKLLASATSTSTIADLLAFHVLEDVPLKQALLSETDVPTRIERLLQGLSEQFNAYDGPIDPSLN